MAESDYLVRLARLVKSNAPGPGRPLGRLRLSLGGVVRDLAERYGERPTEVRLAGLPGPDGVLKLTPDGRAFLTPKQMRAIGGFDRQGTRTKVEFLLPPKRHILDVLFIDAKPIAGAPGEPEQPLSATNYDAATGEVDTNGSGLGITFRVSLRTRGDPIVRLRRMNRRLRKQFKAWLQGFPQGWGIDDGIEAVAESTAKGPGGKRWMVQIVRESRREGKTVGSATGNVAYDGPAYTKFVTAHNDLNASVSSTATGQSFTQKG